HRSRLQVLQPHVPLDGHGCFANSRPVADCSVACVAFSLTPPATAYVLIPCSDAAASTRTIHAYRARVPGDRETRSRPEIKTPLAPGSAERLGERAGDERDGASCSVEESAHRHEPVDHPAITDRVHAHARVP